jgi:dihydroorotate dehydrogenase (NAD+) catalytic subunit
VIEFMLAGATAVQIGTANFADPYVWSKVIEGLHAYLERHGIAAARDLIGAIELAPQKEVHV